MHSVLIANTYVPHLVNSFFANMSQKHLLGFVDMMRHIQWIRLFATKAANIKIEKTDRQTEELSTEITEQKTDKNSYKRDIAILANSQKTILCKERVLSSDVRLYILAVLT